MNVLGLTLLAIMICVPRLAEAQVDLSRPLTVDEHTICLFHLDDVSDAQVQDAAGGSPGSAEDAVPSLGRFGGALSCNGIGGWIDVPDRPATAPEDGITVECWVKFREKAGGDIICRNQSYMMRISGSVQAYFSIDGSWRPVAGVAAVPVGRWTHLAMTYDRLSREVRIYVDGKLDMARMPEGITEGQLDPGASVLRIGSNTWSAAGAVPNAKLDEVRVSSTARSYRPVRPVSAEPVPEDTNLVINPSFESGMHGWRISSEGNTRRLWQIESGDAAHGRALLRAGSPGARGIISYPFRIARGKAHTVSAAMRADRPCQVQIRLRCTGMGKGAPQPGVSHSFDVTRGWQRISAGLSIPADWPTDIAHVEINVRDEARLDVDAVSVVAGDRADYTQTEAQSVGLAAALPSHRTYMLNEGAPLPVEVTNTGEQDRDLALECVVTDWLGRQVHHRQLSLGRVAAGQAIDAQMDLFDQQVGWFVAHFTVRQDGQVIKQTDRAFNVIEPMKGVGGVLDSPLGMNTHMEREPTEHLNDNLNILSLCGVKWIRGWWGWGMAEKEPGRFDWTEYERQLDAVHRAGMEIMPILLRYYPAYEHDWAGKTDRIQQPPYDLGQWGSFVQTTAGRYRGRVKVWEVWNEANYTMEADYYAKLLKVTFDRIRTADPDVTVVGFGGVSPDYIRQVFEAGSAGCMDVMAVHSYAELSRPFERMAGLAEAVEGHAREFGSTHRVWHTEQGSGGDDAGYLAAGQSEEQAAINLVQGYLSALSTGAEKFFWFSAQTTPRYGLAVFYEDYVPRPRLVALNGLARVLNGRRVTGRMDLGEGEVACVLMDGEAGAAAALWNLSDPMTVRLGADVEASWADMLGNRFETETPAGPVTLQLGRPVYLLTDRPGEDLLKATLRQADVSVRPLAAVAVRRAAGGGLEVELRNEGARALDMRVTVKAPDLLPGGVRPVGIADLAPHGTRTVTIEPGSVPASGTEVTVTVEVEFGGQGIRTSTSTHKVAF